MKKKLAWVVILALVLVPMTIGVVDSVGLFRVHPGSRPSSREQDQSEQSKAPAYANVSGTVTYNGNPLEEGQITFSVPAFATDGAGPPPPTVADIVNGKYTLQAIVGTNRVSITAFRKDIPDDYGKNSKQLRVVESGVHNEFDFNIRGK
jgi:hypothetical protein